MKRRPAGTVAAMAASSAIAGSAAAMPRYEVEAHCQQVSQVSEGSSMIYNGCIDMEQTAYNKLKENWEQLPDKARSYCDDVAKVSGGSYQILDGCISMEMDAAGSTPAFEY